MRLGDKIKIGDDIDIMLTKVNGRKQVTIAIQAPRDKYPIERVPAKKKEKNGESD